jgi:hypothetical protein
MNEDKKVRLACLRCNTNFQVVGPSVSAMVGARFSQVLLIVTQPVRCPQCKLLHAYVLKPEIAGFRPIEEANVPAILSPTGVDVMAANASKVR